MPCMHGPIWIGFLLLITTGVAHAGFFQLDVRPASEMLGGHISVHAVLTNRGDEPMRDVCPSVWFDGAWHQGPRYPVLDVGQALRADVDVGDAPALAGVYTAVVSVRYLDANGHPFTTLATIPVHTAVPPDVEPLRATLSDLPLDDELA